MNQPAESLDYDGVSLRRWTQLDAETSYQLVMETLEQLKPWMPWAHNYSWEEALNDLAESRRKWDSGEQYDYGVGVNGRTVGRVSLMRRIGPGGMEIGYWLHPDYTGRGVVTRAVAGLVEQAFALDGVNRIEIMHDTANLASRGIPQRLGFVEVDQRDAELPAPEGTGRLAVWRLRRE